MSYVLQRLAMLPLLLLGITIIGYLLINATPGDPVLMLIDPQQMSLSPEVVAARRAQLGLDQPLPVRYVIWLREAATGNLGYSFRTQRPVMADLGERVWNTTQLFAAAMLIALLLALPLGILAAVRRGTWLDYLSNAVALFAVSIPTFFLALGSIYVFSLTLKLVPTAGMFTFGGGGLFDYLHHLVMPAFVLGLFVSADLMRYTRASVLDVLAHDYIRTARAKGLSERAVLIQHALRTALLPIVTVIGIRIPQFLAGAVIIEVIFQWPGMGQWSLQAIQNRDYPVLMALTLTSAVIVVVVNLLTDLAYARIDPRIRLGASRG